MDNLKNILFITESFYYDPSPNGNCVLKVVNALKKNNHKISVLSLKNRIAKKDEMIEGVFSYRVNSYLEWRVMYNQKIPTILKKILSRVVITTKLLMLSLHPFRSPGVLLSLIKKGEQILKKDEIHTLVCVYRDFETVLAGVILKKRHPHLKLIIYTLDAISGGVCSNKYISSKWHKKNCRMWEKIFLNRCDVFCAMRVHETILSDSYYDLYRDKIKYVDIPNFLPYEDEICEKRNLDEVWRFVYTGLLSETNADCTFFIKVFQEIARERKVRFDIYGGISTGLMQVIEKSGMKENHIFFHGKVSQQELKKVRKDADVFLNFGNNHACGIPCKIFEYLSTAKLIVSFYKIDEDASYKYLKRYPKALLLREEIGREKEYGKKIVSFIESKINEYLSRKEIARMYYENTPDAMVKIIERM